MLFYYTVKFFPEDADLFDSHVNRDGTVTEHGITTGDSYGIAVDKIVEFVGKDNIIEISIYELTDPLNMEEVQELDKF